MAAAQNSWAEAVSDQLSAFSNDVQQLSSPDLKLSPVCLHPGTLGGRFRGGGSPQGDRSRGTYAAVWTSIGHWYRRL